MPRLANKFTFQTWIESERIENESLLGSWFRNSTSIFSHRHIAYGCLDIFYWPVFNPMMTEAHKVSKVVKSFNLYRCKSNNFKKVESARSVTWSLFHALADATESLTPQCDGIRIGRIEVDDKSSVVWGRRVQSTKTTAETLGPRPMGKPGFDWLCRKGTLVMPVISQVIQSRDRTYVLAHYCQPEWYGVDPISMQVTVSRWCWCWWYLLRYLDTSCHPVKRVLDEMVDTGRITKLTYFLTGNAAPVEPRRSRGPP